MVYEPLWTLIPSNKAILPVLWSLFEDYPYLLESVFELTQSLKDKGYVSKPIVGRGGANIAIFDDGNRPAHETGGIFDERDQIFQAYWPLPKPGESYVQVSTFTASGRYAGAGVRIDDSPVITMKSANIALRTIRDTDALSMHIHNAPQRDDVSRS
jgi:glutathionylspermidine amidase/synthetase